MWSWHEKSQTEERPQETREHGDTPPLPVSPLAVKQTLEQLQPALAPSD